MGNAISISCGPCSLGNTVATQPPMILTVTPGGGIVTVTNKNPVYETDTGNIMVGINEKAGTVAVKFLRHTADDAYEEQAKRIRQEARVWQELKHPNILQFIGIAEDDAHRLYLLSPWMENGSLKLYLPRHPDADRSKFILQSAGAIVYLHENDIIHGDIKASNILVSSGTEPKALICDFGLSRSNNERTLPGLKGTGTVRWQAPELWDNQSKTYQSDSYSFGMTIYEVLSGNEPYHDCKVHANLLARINRNERPPKTPEACPHSDTPWKYMWDVAEQCWKALPDERPSMKTVYRWLQNKAVDDSSEPADGPSNKSSPSDEIAPASPAPPLTPKKTTPLEQMG